MLKAEFASINKTLSEELDGLMVRFKATDPAFYAAYVAAHEVIDNPGGRPAKNGNGADGHDTPTPPQ